jgi:3-hydroxybutyryl-CoA dehydrogenase
MSDRNTVLIIGAGAMGAGIAQVAAAAGWRVLLCDVDDAVVDRAIDAIIARLDRMAEKKRMTSEARDEAVANLFMHSADDDLSGCGLVIEAVVEDLDVKTNVLSRFLGRLPSSTIIATNTSSLSITALGDMLGEAQRTVGMHFFNPAPLMKLVEVIAGAKTDPAIAERVADIARSWGKVVARAADAPGFIVNHVARPYYLEAFRLLEDGVATPSAIDAAMRDDAGFRMGPLELTDLIGQDVNAATTRSVWEQLDRPPLLAPSAMQERLVASGALGRKSGTGVYDYSGETPAEHAAAERAAQFTLSSASSEAADAFCSAAGIDACDPTRRYVIARILGALIAQAHMAVARGVASPEDIDAALTFGVNYPCGPFAWFERAGADAVHALAAALDAECAPPRFQFTPLALTESTPASGK